MGQEEEEEGERLIRTNAGRGSGVGPVHPTGHMQSPRLKCCSVAGAAASVGAGGRAPEGQLGGLGYLEEEGGG